MSAIVITRTGPLTNLQDRGRFGMLKHGISASGPMDAGAFESAGALLGEAGDTAIEFTTAGLAFAVEGSITAATGGGDFTLTVNGIPSPWPARLRLQDGDLVDIAPGPSGTYGYVRFDHELDVAPALGSRSTNVTVGLGGLDGRALQPGDRIKFGAPGRQIPAPGPKADVGPIRVLWGLHAERVGQHLREEFTRAPFVISTRLDRMGVRLDDPARIFSDFRQLSLVSDAIVPGDIQVLGDGTPIVLMRDHQPTGGYPRIATIVSADLDRFAQMRPGTEVRFRPVTLEHAN